MTATTPAIQHVGGRPKGRQPAGQPKGRQQGRKTKCYGCGSNKHVHGSDQCPAKGKPCNKCGRQNHFASQCRSKDPAQNPINKVGKEDHFPPIFIKAWIHDGKDHVPVDMEVDSGAKPSTLDEDTYNRLFSKMGESGSRLVTPSSGAQNQNLG